MKRSFAIFFVVALVSVFGAAACGGEGLEQRVAQLEEQVQQQEEEIQSIKVSEQELQDGDEELFEEGGQNGGGRQ